MDSVACEAENTNPGTEENRARAAARRNNGRRIQKVRARGREVCRRLLAGEKPKDIAQDMGYASGMTLASTVHNSRHMQEYINELTERADEDVIHLRNRIGRMIPLALDYYDRVLSGAEDSDISHGDKIKVAESVLKKGGLPDVQRQEVVSAPTTTTAGDLHAAQEKYYAAARAAGILIDVTPSEASSG